MFFRLRLSLHKIIHWLLLLFLFLLPWQARWLYGPAYLNGGFWEYGSASWFATEVLLWVIIILFLIDRFRHRELWQKILTLEHWQNYRKRLLYCCIVILFFGLQIAFSLNRAISFNHIFWLIEGVCLFVVVASQLSSRAESLGGAGPALSLSNGSRDPLKLAGKQTSRDSSAPSPASWGSVGSPRCSSGEAGRNDRNRFLLAFWLGGVVQGILAIWQFFTQAVVSYPFSGIAWHYAWQLGDGVVETATERWLRPYGSLSGPNPLGMYLAAAWIIGLIIYLFIGRDAIYRVSRWWKIGITIGQLIILSGLIFSFSRGAWIAAVGGVLCVITKSVAIAKRRSNPLDFKTDLALQPGDPDIPFDSSRDSLRVLGMMPLIRQFLYSLILVSCFLFFFTPLFTARLTATTRLEIKSITERASQYQQAWQIIQQRPWWGVGPGTYTLALYNQNPNLPVWQYQPVHNSYLLILSEIGPIGFGIVLLFYCYIALPRRSSTERRRVSLSRRSSTERRRVSLLWRRNSIFFPALAVLFISAFFDHFWWSLYGGMMIWWAVLGLSTRRG